ncbi:MAG TPA: hypothetical protein VNO14_00705 [Blastocatellia bacterium]|nr:hypothetical protein [Blastocatellia bacterium]
MRDYCAGPFRRLFLLVVAAALILTSPPQSLAQRNRARDSAAAAKARDTELYHREMRLKHLGKDSKKLDDKEQRLLLVQIKEDFEELQRVHNETMRTVSNSQSLDYKLISATLAEINKRARRLKGNLAIPSVEKASIKTKDAATDEELMASLLALDDLIMSFVTNPLFQNPSVINIEHSAKAGRDLEGIIYLSQNVKKSADRLNKSADRR